MGTALSVPLVTTTRFPTQLPGSSSLPPRLGQTSSPGWGGTSQDWFLSSGSLVCVFLHLAASSYNGERIGKQKHSSGSWASCL